MAKLIDIGFPSSGSSVSNGGTITDDSGNGVSLTVGGGAMGLTTGQGGTAGVADGTTYARSGANAILRPATAVTWMCWLRRTGTPSWGAIMGYANNAGWGLAYGFYTQSDDAAKIHMNLTSNLGETETPNNSNILTLNTWVHVAGVWAAADTTLRLFVNGSQSQTWSRTGANVLYDNASHGFGLFRSDQFTGEMASALEMDEARVFDTALSGSEIITEMNTRSGAAAPKSFPFRRNPSRGLIMRGKR